MTNRLKRHFDTTPNDGCRAVSLCGVKQPENGTRYHTRSRTAVTCGRCIHKLKTERSDG